MLRQDGGHLGLSFSATISWKVLPGGEGFAGAGEVNSADLRVVLALIEPGLQGEAHLPVETVVNLGRLRVILATW